MNDDFVEMLSALSEEGAEYLIVGAYAVGAHAVPRSTGDIDLWIRPSAENARRVWKALVRFGAPLLDLAEADLATPGTVFQIGVPPRRIDLLTAVSGVEFEEAWVERTSCCFGPIVAPVIGLRSLLKNKRACGRARDLADVETLERLV